MADSWIEPHTRIPFVGIVAMVLIVAVVAVFIKTQLAPLFPAAEVTVEDENSLTGRASESFYGLREVDLERKELLVGSVNRKSGPMEFSVDAPNLMLTITASRNTEQIELQAIEGVLKSRFEYDAAPTLVVVDAPARTLTFSTVSTMPIVVTLNEQVTYTGGFTHKGRSYDVVFMPAAGELLIDGQNVQVSQDGKTYNGIWTVGKSQRPIAIDAEKMLLTIQDVY